MKYVSVKLGRKFNMGNYETMDIQVEALLNENEHPQEVLEQLERDILFYYTNRNKIGRDLADQIGRKGFLS